MLNVRVMEGKQKWANIRKVIELWMRVDICIWIGQIALKMYRMCFWFGRFFIGVNRDHNEVQQSP